METTRNVREIAHTIQDTIAIIQQSYPRFPALATITGNDKSFFFRMLMFIGQQLNDLDQVKKYYYRTDCTKEVYDLRCDMAHPQKLYSEDESYVIFQNFFNHLTPLYQQMRNISTGTFSPHKRVRSYEQTSSPRGSSENKKRMNDSIITGLNPALKPEERVSPPQSPKHGYSNAKKRQEQKTHTAAPHAAAVKKSARLPAEPAASAHTAAAVLPRTVTPPELIFTEAQIDLTAAVEPVFELETPQQNDLFVYAQEHTGLHEAILLDIIEWIKRMDREFSRNNPFLEEELFITDIHAVSAGDFTVALLSTLSRNYEALPTVSDTRRGSIGKSSVDFAFYSSKLAETENLEASRQETETIPHSRETLLRNLINDIHDSYIIRKTEWEMAQLEKSRAAFKQELFEKINRFQQLESLLVPFINNLGYLWDLSNTPFQDCGFELLQQYADLLNRDEFLTELARLIGRQEREQISYEQAYRNSFTSDLSYRTRPAYRGEIAGLRLSNEISSVLPSELALYKNPLTQKYFMLKFAQKQLLSYAYECKTASVIDTGNEQAEEPELNLKGPVLMCVDTSASMHGMPEQIAKTITFALTKIALEEQRSCFLISFSTGIEFLDLSSFQGPDALHRLTAFLRKNFNGGTDAAPALNHAVQLLQKNEWKNADVLMISDFMMDSVSEDLAQRIQTEQEKQTGFYSLVIGKSSNPKSVRVFNENWNYNPYDNHAQKVLVTQLDNIRKRNVTSNRYE